MKTIKIAILGFGNAGRAFAELLKEKEAEIESCYDCKVNIVAIATKSKGSLVNEKGIDLTEALKQIKDEGTFHKASSDYSSLCPMEIAKNINYDVLLELTPLAIFSGQPAIDHIKTAFDRNKHVVTANKGPIAWCYDELKKMAEEKGVGFYHETTVMDGTPVFNMVETNLKMCKVIEIKGILNSTTNFILEELGKGKDYYSVLEEGRERGFVEADSSLDIEGWDSAAKITALLNVLMSAKLTPKDIIRKGIEEITAEDIKGAEARGKKIKLICTGWIENGKVCGKVWPEEVDKNNIMATINGTSSIISLKTDLMGTVTVIEEDPEINQTAYGVFGDMLRVLEKIKQG